MISELLRVREAIERKRIDKAIKIAEKLGIPTGDLTLLSG